MHKYRTIPVFTIKLEDTARYAGLLLAPAEGFGLRPRLFLPFGQKKELIILFWTIFVNFWCPVITLVTVSSNLSNFERNPKKKKIQKFKKMSKNQEEKKYPKNPIYLLEKSQKKFKK